MGINSGKRHHHHKSRNSVEEFKRKGLMVQKNRKRMAKIMLRLLLLVLSLLVMACILSMFDA